MTDLPPPSPPRPPQAQVDAADSTFEETRAKIRAGARPSGKARRTTTQVQAADGSVVDLTQSDEVTLDKLMSVLDKTKDAAKKNADVARVAQSAARQEDSGLFKLRHAEDADTDEEAR